MPEGSADSLTQRLDAGRCPVMGNIFSHRRLHPDARRSTIARHLFSARPWQSQSLVLDHPKISLCDDFSVALDKDLICPQVFWPIVGAVQLPVISSSQPVELASHCPIKTAAPWQLISLLRGHECPLSLRLTRNSSKLVLGSACLRSASRKSSASAKLMQTASLTVSDIERLHAAALKRNARYTSASK